MRSLFTHLAEKYGLNIISYHPLSGGDISQVYHLKTSSDDLVIKINEADKKSMFLSEKQGLKAIQDTHTFRVPLVYEVGEFLSYSYLLIEFIATGEPHDKTFYNFGVQLNELHSHDAQSFGFDSDNLIGSLPQKNLHCTTWSQFYWEQRILPQYQRASQLNLISHEDIPKENIFLKVIDEEFCSVKPSLIHGDLWNGNYLVDDAGQIVLIDPAVYYGHPMMDIGMSQLFGGFPNAFIMAYNKQSPCKKNWQNQIELAQWYYLLVHLNLFGKSYLSAVQRIKNKWMHA